MFYFCGAVNGIQYLSNNPETDETACVYQALLRKYMRGFLKKISVNVRGMCVSTTS